MLTRVIIFSDLYDLNFHDACDKQPFGADLLPSRWGSWRSSINILHKHFPSGRYDLYSVNA